MLPVPWWKSISYIKKYEQQQKKNWNKYIENKLKLELGSDLHELKNT